MPDLLLELLRIFGIALCFGLPAYALLYFDGPEW